MSTASKAARAERRGSGLEGPMRCFCGQEPHINGCTGGIDCPKCGRHVLSGHRQDCPEYKAPKEPAGVPAMALVRSGLGHQLVELRLPASVIEAYTITRTASDLRAINAARLVEWVERV